MFLEDYCFYLIFRIKRVVILGISDKISFMPTFLYFPIISVSIFINGIDEITYLLP